MCKKKKKSQIGPFKIGTTITFIFTKKQTGAKTDITNFKICSFFKGITILKLHKEGKMVKNTLLYLFLISVKDFRTAVFIENNLPPAKATF